MRLLFVPFSRRATRLAILFALCGPAAAQMAPAACPNPALARTGEQAFELFCLRCHQSERLTAAFEKAADPAEVEQQLALFLDRHGSCPHDRHDAIAAYLRGRSGR